MSPLLNTEPGPEPDTTTELTATDVTDDLLNRRSASLNFRFLLSVLLLEFLCKTNGGSGHQNHTSEGKTCQTFLLLLLLLVGEVAVPSSDDVPVHLGVLQVAPLEGVDLSLQVHQCLLLG